MSSETTERERRSDNEPPRERCQFERDSVLIVKTFHFLSILLQEQGDSWTDALPGFKVMSKPHRQGKYN